MWDALQGDELRLRLRLRLQRRLEKLSGILAELLQTVFAAEVIILAFVFK